MMRIIGSSVVILGLLAFAQEPNIVWTKTYGTTSNYESIRSIRQTPDGGFIMVGHTGNLENSRVYLIKTDCFGNIEWTMIPNYYGCEGRCINYALDDGYVVVGIRYMPTTERPFFMKFSSSGTLELYREYYDGSSANYIQPTSDGYYFIVGNKWLSDEHLADAWAFKVRPNATILWEHTLDAPLPYGDEGRAGCETQYDPDFGYLFTGKWSYPADYNIFLEKINYSGMHVWTSGFGSTDEDEGNAIKEVFDGYVIVGLYTDRAWLVKRDFEGNPVWSKFIDQPGFHFSEGFDLEVTADDGFIICGARRLSGSQTTTDVYVVKTDADGDILWSKTIGGDYRDEGYSIASIGEDEYIIAGGTLSYGAGQTDMDGYLIKLGYMLGDTDDPLALAYNDNRHLVREPNAEKLHLVYTRQGEIIYLNSTNGGVNWESPVIIGDGKLPAIILSSNNLPSIAWTDDIGGIYYRRQTAAGVWGDVYHLWDPWSLGQPALNSAPSIAITPSVQGDSVHILVTLHVAANGPVNWVADFAFRIDDPMAGMFNYIEGGSGYPQAGAIRYNPSIVKDNQSTLHAVWQRADTICYAVKPVNQSWDNWGWQFELAGLKSAHPFVESYGDMVYVVWQRKETPATPEEVYKGWRQHGQPIFYRVPFSLTPNTRSLYPVNANGLFTVFADSPEPPINGFEIYYKTTASEPWFNISQTLTNSNYPQSAARYFAGQAKLYTVWLDGDHVPYGIHFKSLSYIPMEMPAYYTSINGYATPSSYLVDRDSFISEWQVPVDIGNETITYRFLLDPGYKYRLRAIAHHEQTGEWREWIKLDDKLKHQIKYNAYDPETLEMWIPPAYYRDGVIDMVFERIRGDYAIAGMIEIWQYEYDEGENGSGGGPMAIEVQAINKIAVRTTPNPFNHGLNLELQVTNPADLDINIYDITGRLVKELYVGIITSNCELQWNGDDRSGRKVPQGVYFIQIDNLANGESSVSKVLKVR